jgi:uncharacterized RDD family membrane protein YckC
MAQTEGNDASPNTTDDLAQIERALAEYHVENPPVAPQLLPAPLGRRYAAAVLDVFICGLLTSCLNLIVSTLALRGVGPHFDANQWLQASVFVALATLYAAIEPLAGNSIGKSFLGLRPAGAGATSSGPAAWRRFALKNAWLIATLLFSIAATARAMTKTHFEFDDTGWSVESLSQVLVGAVLVMLVLLAIRVGPQRQTLYDLLAGTNVYHRATPRHVRGFTPVLTPGPRPTPEPSASPSAINDPEQV